MNKPKCFVELCAGTAALSVRLVGGKDAKPPVSRMGAKTGYADVILSVLGLYPGLGAESFVWCEPDDGVRGLLMAYCQPSVLKEAASILRSWKDEEPRALWERLRAELKAGASVEGAEGVARHTLVIAQTWPHKMDGRPIEQWMQKVAEDDTISAVSVEALADRITAVPSLPPTFIARDGRAVTPEEVARFVQLLGANRLIPGTIADDGRWVNAVRDGGPQTDGGVSFGGEEFATSAGANADSIARAAAMKWPPITLAADARTLTPPRLPEGVIAYMDPPYLNTTGYKHDLPRAEVVRLARLWADAGATVCISEQTTIPELIADGWHGVQISFARKGQKRTFSEQQDEYLTINRKPAFIPREPEPMFDDLKVVKKQKVKVVRVSQPTEPQPINQSVQTLNLFGGNDD